MYTICFPQTFSTMNAPIFNIHDCNLIDNATCNFDFTNSVFTSLLQTVVLTVLYTNTFIAVQKLDTNKINDNTFPLK